MLLSIVITTRNRKSVLLHCVESICESNLPKDDWELIIVDDCSSDGTEKMDMSQFNVKMGKIIHNTTQQMMVRTRNHGAKIAHGKYVLFVDDDNIVHKDMISVLLSYAQKFPQYGMLGPSMYFFDTKEKYLDCQIINLYTGKTTSYINTAICPKNNILESDGIPNVFMISHSLLKKINYFDESLIQTYTEPDLAYRLKKIGYKSVCISDAITYHNVKHTRYYGPRTMGGGEFKQKAYFLMRNRTVLVMRYANYVQKIIYLLFFSWLWPLLYSLVMILYQKYDLVRLYWLGYTDGIRYMITGTLKSSL